MRLRDDLTGDEMLQNINNWLAPPDPWKNHNIAREAQLDGTAAWWIDGEMFEQWKYSEGSSFIWIHGKRQCFMLPSFRCNSRISPLAGAGKSVFSYVGHSRSLTGN
jgi:hypothetical protein